MNLTPQKLLEELKENINGRWLKGEFLISTAILAYYWINLESISLEDEPIYIEPISKFVVPWLKNKGTELVIVPNVKFYSMGIVRAALQLEIENVVEPIVSWKGKENMFRDETGELISPINGKKAVLIEPLSLHIDLILNVMKQAKDEGCDVLYVVVLISRDTEYVKEEIERCSREYEINDQIGALTKFIPLVIFEEEFKVEELLEDRKPKLSTLLEKDDLKPGDGYFKQFHPIFDVVR